MGHGGRLGIIGAAIALLAGGCGGTADEDEILGVVLESLLSGDPAKCERIYTLGYMENRSGESGDEAIEECRKRARDRDGAPDSAQVRIETIEDDYALTSGTMEGGAFDGATFKYVLREEDGAWMIDALTDVEVDREDYDAYARRKLVEDEDLTPREASCTVAELRTLISTEELEDSARTGDEPAAPYAKAASRCLSVDSKTQEIAEGLRETGRERGINSAIVACVLERLRALPDPRIDELYAESDSLESQQFIGGLFDRCATAAPVADA